MKQKLVNAYFEQRSDGSSSVSVRDWENKQYVVIWLTDKTSPEMRRIFALEEEPWPRSVSDYEPPASP